MVQRKYLSCRVFSAFLQREQPGQVGALTLRHAMPQPDLGSDILGVVEGRTDGDRPFWLLSGT